MPKEMLGNKVVVLGVTGSIAAYKAVELAKDKGANRVIPLQVSGAFHSRLMQPAVDGMSEFIGSLSFKEPTIPVVANTTGEPIKDAESIKSELLNQLRNPVQWQRSIEYMVNTGVSTFIEIGPGKVLTGLIKRINKEVETMNIGDLETVKGLVN